MTDKRNWEGEKGTEREEKRTRTQDGLREK